VTLESAIGASPYEALDSPEGAALLDALAGFDEEHAAAAAQRARSLATPDVARAALATTFARRRARASGKFADPDSMFFTRAGYEQSTSEAVARHRAGRFAGMSAVAELCCGIGSDTIALAERVDRVHACDLDPDALACASYNVRARGMDHKVKLTPGDASQVSLEGMSAAFADPSRRPRDERVRDVEAYSPPLQALLARAHELPGGRLSVKVAPGIDLADLSITASLRGLPLEAEFISERGTCKEAALWCGAFARADDARSATAIDASGVHVIDGDPSIVGETGPIQDHVGEPDPAVIRSGLLGALCANRHWRVLDRRVAYVTNDKPVDDTFVHWYRVRDLMTFGIKRLREYLRERNIGELVIKTRAFPLKPDELRILLKPHGSNKATLICTTIQGKKTAIVCDAVQRPNVAVEL